MYFQLIGLNCRFTHSCLALFYVRNALRRNLPRAEISIEQWTINDPYYDTLLKISSVGADVIFISVYIWNALYVSRLLGDLALVRPDVPVILGGPQASALSGLPENCTIVEGEIEGIGSEFYRDLEAGKLKSCYSGAAGADFPSPYVDDDFFGPLQNRHVYYESSRGCPFRCSYCLSSLSKGVVHKNVEQVEREIDAILKHRPKIVKFVDRTFNDNPARSLAIWQYLAAAPGKTRFHFEIAPDRFTDEMLDFLETVDADRFQFEIGIQSTNTKTLDAINRKMDVDKAAENIRRLVGFDNIHLHVDLILGLPYETRESFRRSFNMVFSLGAHYIQMGLLKVLPETPISSETEDFGLVFCRQPPYEILANRWLDHQQLGYLNALGECVEAFYNNRYFPSLWQYLRESDENPYTFFAALLAVRQQKKFVDAAPTQELLTRVFFEAAADRGDRELVLELLQYDWLHCGHRFLPDVFDLVSWHGLRDELWTGLPQNMDGLYDHRGRRGFFKRAVFLALSARALQQVGIENKGRAGIVCFLPEQTGGVFKHSQAILLESR